MTADLQNTQTTRNKYLQIMQINRVYFYFYGIPPVPNAGGDAGCGIWSGDGRGTGGPFEGERTAGKPRGGG